MNQPKLSTWKNLVGSAYFLVVRPVANMPPLLLLSGYVYASSPGSLTVISLQPFKPVVLLHEQELALVQLTDLDADGVPEFVTRPCFSQQFGDGWLTYDPLHVYKITAHGQFEISLPLTKEYNLKHYYGWAGLECREDVVAVRVNGKYEVMTLKQAEALSSKRARKR